jgi:acyl transferase domain-containing protein
MVENPQAVPLAVVGMGAAFAHASTLRTFWRIIAAGEDCIREVPRNRWLPEDYYDPDPSVRDKTYTTRGSFLASMDFDPARYGVPPKLLPHTDAAQLLGLVVADQLLANIVPKAFATVDRERVCLVMGVANGTGLLCEMSGRSQRPVWMAAMRERGIPAQMASEICDRICEAVPDWSEATFPGLLGNVVSGRIANRLDLRGINFTTDAACASSLSSLLVAVRELQAGSADLAIAGGVDATNDAFTFTCFSKTPALSPTGDCRPFSVDADGTILGEGVGMVALRRLPDALRDGDRIYALIRGIGSASDGRGTSVYAPLSAGQARALRLSYENAGYGPETVGLVEAHGTGTLAGDQAEMAALLEVFGQGKGPRSCALGSIKSQIGHAKAASGIASLIKAVMSLHHKVLPPTLKVRRPRPELESETCPFYLNTLTRPWISPESSPRRASVSSFGFGGVNFHLALEEHSERERRAGAGRVRSLASELVLLSNASGEGLRARCRSLLEAGLPAGSLVHLARESQAEFDPEAEARLALVAGDEAELLDRLRTIVSHPLGTAGDALPEGVFFAEGGERAEVAVLFPGPGNQRLEMGAALACEFDLARSVWDREAAHPVGPRALHELVYPPPTWDEARRRADLEALGRPEWAEPATAATSLSHWALLAALRLAPRRLIGSGVGEWTALCAASAVSEPALLSLARAHGEDAAASGNAARALAALEIGAPQVEVWSLAQAAAYPADPESVRRCAALAETAAEGLLADAIEAAHAAGIRIFLDLAPGGAVSALVTRTLAGRPHRTIALDAVATDGVTAFWRALAELAVSGCRLSFDALWAEYTLDADPRSAARVLMPMKVGARNLGRSYPPLDGKPATTLPRSTQWSPEMAVKTAPPIPAPPVAPAPVAPARVATAPVATARVAPAPVATAPVAPAPVVTAPVAPAPVAPAPVAPAPGPESPPPVLAALGGHAPSVPVMQWLRSLDESNRLTNAVHLDHQRMMGQSHLAYLEYSQLSIADLLASGEPPPK